jgi:aspartyl-tRNA(Asn)/glutamyl-tRNA(Gln) amidotransferase subunit C
MNIEDLKETAALAHLNLKDEELEAAFPSFTEMLGFFAAMQEADNDVSLFPKGAAETPAGQNALARSAGAAFFRSDKPWPGGVNNLNLNENILNNAGERDGRFLVIPNVL